MTISIPTTTSNDAALLAEIGEETFVDSFGVDNTPENMAFYLASAFSPEIQAQELADLNSFFLIAEMEGETVGYARLKEGAAPKEVIGIRPVELVRIYARKAWIGQGIGAALMQACLDETKRRGCDTLWLVVWEHNPRAIAFYQKWGFVKVGKHIFQMGDDPQTGWVMQRGTTP